MKKNKNICKIVRFIGIPVLLGILVFAGWFGFNVLTLPKIDEYGVPKRLMFIHQFDKNFVLYEGEISETFVVKTMRYTDEELAYIKFEIMAKEGYPFYQKDVQEYFDNKEWYIKRKPNFTATSYILTDFNDIPPFELCIGICDEDLEDRFLKNNPNIKFEIPYEDIQIYTNGLLTHYNDVFYYLKDDPDFKNTLKKFNANQIKYMYYSLRACYGMLPKSNNIEELVYRSEIIMMPRGPKVIPEDIFGVWFIDDYLDDIYTELESIIEGNYSKLNNPNCAPYNPIEQLFNSSETESNYDDTNESISNDTTDMGSEYVGYYSASTGFVYNEEYAQAIPDERDQPWEYADAYQGDYADDMISDSSMRYLTEADVVGWSKENIRLAKNEIYARHGYIFKSQDLYDYFAMNTDWYNPTVLPENWNDSWLNEYERANVSLLQSIYDGM